VPVGRGGAGQAGRGRDSRPLLTAVTRGRYSRPLLAAVTRGRYGRYFRVVAKRHAQPTLPYVPRGHLSYATI